MIVDHKTWCREARFKTAEESVADKGEGKSYLTTAQKLRNAASAQFLIIADKQEEHAMSKLLRNTADEMDRLTDELRGTVTTKYHDEIVSFAVKQIAEKDKQIASLEDVLREIRDVANCSEGVEFYAMLANEALSKK
jgi:uncharacterized FlaG/YvyC family protein